MQKNVQAGRTEEPHRAVAWRKDAREIKEAGSTGLWPTGGAGGAGEVPRFLGWLTGDVIIQGQEQYLQRIWTALGRSVTRGGACPMGLC